MYYAILVFRWLHVLAAITLMGGSVFLRFALLPAVATLPVEAQQQLKSAVRGRWAKFVMAAIGFLLLSGLVNYVLTVRQYHLPHYYHLLFGVKFSLALVIFYIASLLVGRSATAERIRQKAAFWLNVNLALALLVVCLAGTMRFVDRTPKAGLQAPAVSAAAAIP